MKILIANRFFGGAQIPTGRMAEDVARLLAKEGHEVFALASSGEYAGAVAQARDQETAEWSETARGLAEGNLNDDPPTRSPLQPAPAGQGALMVETVDVPKWTPRALVWLWFTWQARRRIPKMDWDVCVLMTDPPLLPLLAARLKAKKTKRQKDKKPITQRRVAVWLMDLYPEALAASGRIGTGNPIYQWYFEKRQKALGASDLLVFLGETQKALVEKYEGVNVAKLEDGDKESEFGRHRADGMRQTKTAVVPPWDDRGNIALATEDSLKHLALYAGNLGEAHCFEEILAAAPHLPGDWTIRFAARGAKFAALRARVNTGHSRPEGTAGAAEDSPKANSVRRSRGQIDASQKKASHGLRGLNTDGVRAAAPTGLGGSAYAVGPTALAVGPPNEEAISRGAVVETTGYASEEETPDLLASARVHLITMSPGWEGIVVPSKLYGCVRTGRPVLFIGPENADTAREIRAHDWGTVLPPGASGEEVSAAILELAARPNLAVRPEKGAQRVAELIKTLAMDGHG